MSHSTRIIALLACILAFATSGYSKHYPMPDTTTGHTMSMIVQLSIQPSIDGNPFQMNDEIGVFDAAGNCFGSASWDNVHNINVRIFGDNEFVAGKQGFYGGDTIKFRVWDTSLAMEFKASAQQSGGAAIRYSDNAICILKSLAAASMPTAPALAWPVNGAANQPLSLSIGWQSMGSASSYTVQVSTSQSFAATLASISGITLTTQQINLPAINTTYYWRLNTTGIGGTGAWSTPWSFMTIPPPPPTPALSAPVNGAALQTTEASLNWGTVSGAAAYSVQLSTSVSFSSGVVSGNGLVSPSVVVGALALNSTYYWRANAANAGGTASWSGTWSFSTPIQLDIPVTGGWNMISLNVRLQDSSISTLVGDQSKGMLLVKNLAGRVYWPIYGIDDLDTVHLGQGYQLYSDSTDTIRAQGATVDVASAPVSLGQGWNMVGYLPQSSIPITSALAGISSSVTLVKNNSGEIYWPQFGIDDIGTMDVGVGYLLHMKAAAILVYPAGSPKPAAAPGVSSLPAPHHYPMHPNTGDNATFLVHAVTLGEVIAPDSSEIGAYDEHGTCVGRGCVLHGVAAITVWGADRITRKNAGCGNSDRISFKLWDGGKEYPLDFTSEDGKDPRYASNGIFTGMLSSKISSTAPGLVIPHVYPNPFRGAVRIAFDVAPLQGKSVQNVEIGLFDMKGTLIRQIAAGPYAEGHYTVTWNAPADNAGSTGSNVYILRMKTQQCDKRIKLIRVK